jgi:hypothetical protein
LSPVFELAILAYPANPVVSRVKIKRWRKETDLLSRPVIHMLLNRFFGFGVTGVELALGRRRRGLLRFFGGTEDRGP